MKPVAAKILKSGRFGGARGFVVFIAALGFLLQSFITQTHIHSGAFETGGIFQTTGQSQAPEKAPVDKSSCPFCQAIVHAGAFVTPAPVLVYQSFVWVKTVPYVFLASTVSGEVSHDWRSRAPPRI
jgi:hypothetical protein